MAVRRPCTVRLGNSGAEDLDMNHLKLSNPPTARIRRGRRSIVGAALAVALLASLSAAPAFAAAAFVQTVGTNFNETSGTTLIVTSGVTTTVGNTIIVTFAMDPASGTVSCVDSKGNTYAQDADIANGSGTSGVRTVVFSAPIGTALVSGDTITVTLPTAVAKAMSVNEFSGLVTSSPTDQSGTAIGNSTTPSATTSGAITQFQELGIGGLGREGKVGRRRRRTAGPDDDRVGDEPRRVHRDGRRTDVARRVRGSD